MTGEPPIIYLVVTAVLFVAGLRVMHELWRRTKLGPFVQALSPQNKIWLADLARSLGDDRVIVEGHTVAALRLWNEAPETARQRLGLACEHVEKVAQPEMLRAVKILDGLARTVRIVPPPRPLAVAAYRLACTRGWAALAALVHWLVLTGADRARVRLWFARRVFVAAARVFTQAARRALARENYPAPTWAAPVRASTHDLWLAQEETVVTAEQILIAFTTWQTQCMARPAPAL